MGALSPPLSVISSMHAQNGVKIALPKQSACTIRYNTYQVPGNLKKVQFGIRFHLLWADDNNNNNNNNSNSNYNNNNNNNNNIHLYSAFLLVIQSALQLVNTKKINNSNTT